MKKGGFLNDEEMVLLSFIIFKIQKNIKSKILIFGGLLVVCYVVFENFHENLTFLNI